MLILVWISGCLSAVGLLSLALGLAADALSIWEDKTWVEKTDLFYGLGMAIFLVGIACAIVCFCIYLSNQIGSKL